MQEVEVPVQKPFALSPLATAITLSLLFLTILLLRSAWAADTAFIAFRVMGNLAHGYGMRWNVDERVEVFTAPLFILIGAIGTVLTSNTFLTITALSIVLTLATFLVITRGSDIWGVAFALVILCFSRAFVDFSVAGLENPLTGLLVALFFRAYWRARGPATLSFLAALAALNQLDTLFLFAPALVLSYRQRGFWRWKPILWAWSPLLLWKAFALFYFGFPFSNSAYSRWYSGIGWREQLLQGMLYFVNAFNHDIVTVFAIGIALAVAWLVREYAVAIGLAFYLLIITVTGGDFMGGRWFTVPLVVATMVLIRYGMPNRTVAIGAMAIVAALGFWIPEPTLTSATASFHAANPLDQSGVGDERGAAYLGSGLLRYRREAPWPDDPTSRLALEQRAHRPRVYLWQEIGAFGVNIGPETHVIDPFGRADGLLARLPLRIESGWRPGLYLRNVPSGYDRTLETGQNQIADHNIAEYFRHLRTVVSGNLWSFERFKEIVLLNFGAYDYLLPKQP